MHTFIMGEHDSYRETFKVGGDNKGYKGEGGGAVVESLGLVSHGGRETVFICITLRVTGHFCKAASKAAS